MIYGHHVPSVLPPWAPFPGRTAPLAAGPPGEDDDTEMDIEEPAAVVPAPRDGSGR
jgi:hypothetical protein